MNANNLSTREEFFKRAYKFIFYALLFSYQIKFASYGKLMKPNLNWQELKEGNNPIAFFVSGFGGHVDYVTSVLHQKLKSQGMSIFDLAWNDIYGRQSSVYLRFTAARFIDQMVNEVIPNIAPHRPIILIGYSLGGDTLLKLAHKINQRKIAFLGILDAVQPNGKRTINSVPRNVSYFFNRWTVNPSFLRNFPEMQIPKIGYKIGIPLNAYQTGELLCDSSLTFADQEEQSYAFNADGTPILLPKTSNNFPANKSKFSSDLVTPKYQPITHSYQYGIHRDLYIQEQMFNIIIQKLNPHSKDYCLNNKVHENYCFIPESRSHLMIA